MVLVEAQTIYWLPPWHKHSVHPEQRMVHYRLVARAVLPIADDGNDDAAAAAAAAAADDDDDDDDGCGGGGGSLSWLLARLSFFLSALLSALSLLGASPAAAHPTWRSGGGRGCCAELPPWTWP